MYIFVFLGFGARTVFFGFAGALRCVVPQGAVADLHLPRAPTLVVSNPPWGQRLDGGSAPRGGGDRGRGRGGRMDGGRDAPGRRAGRGVAEEEGLKQVHTPVQERNINRFNYKL
jgi:hypothetical protein